MSWQDHAERLWGEEWIAPMSEVLDINRRTIERWRAGEGGPGHGLKVELQRLALHYNARATGGILRRMASGETLDDIRREIREQAVAIASIQAAIGKYSTIAILAARTELAKEE